MSEWQYTLGKPLSWDEGYFTPRYPRHVAQTFLAVASDEEMGEDERYVRVVERDIQRFAERWGGLSQDAFRRALHEGNRRERLRALFAIGCDATFPEATMVLASFLASSDQLERCAAVCLLSLRRDERAFSGMEEYLLCEPPPPEDPQAKLLSTSDALVWYPSYRSRVARLLATWGPKSVVRILRQALLHLLALEERYGASGYGQTTQNALCSSLGRRGALAALHGVDLPDQQKRIALVYLGLGYVDADERFERLYDALLFDPHLKQELITVFLDHFALSPEESQAILRAYPTDIQRREYATYGIGELDETPIIIKHVTHSEKDEQAKDAFQ